MGKLRVLNMNGDKTLEWTQESVKGAKDEFDRIVAAGGLAYRVDGPGKGSAIGEFDPDADEIVVTRAIAGG